MNCVCDRCLCTQTERKNILFYTQAMDKFLLKDIYYCKRKGYIYINNEKKINNYLLGGTSAQVIGSELINMSVTSLYR